MIDRPYEQVFFKRPAARDPPPRHKSLPDFAKEDNEGA